MSIKFLGQFLLERGKIIREELLEALNLTKSTNLSIGQIALESEDLTREQIDSICICQKSTDKLFGEIAVEKKYLTQEQVDELLMIQKNERFSLRDALIQKGYLTMQELQEEMKYIQERSEAIEAKNLEVIQASKHPDVEQAFIDVALKMLRRVAQMDLACYELHRDKNKQNAEYWNINQAFYGDISGIFTLSISEKTFLKIASEMIQEQQRKIDDLSKDAGKEFVNMVLGNVAVRLSEKGTKISIKLPEISTKLNDVIDTDELLVARFVSSEYEVRCILCLH